MRIMDLEHREREATPDEAFELGKSAGWDEAFDAVAINLESHLATARGTGFDGEFVVNMIIRELPHLRALRPGWEAQARENVGSNDG